MELSKRTLAVLKLFSSVNENLVFKPGKTQRTIATDEGIFVEAEIDEEIPREFSICGLATFLRNLEMADKTTLELDVKTYKVYADTSMSQFGYGSPALIKSPPDKSLDIPAGVVVVPITKDKLALVIKIAEINSLPNIGIGSDGTNFYLSAFDSKNPDSAKTNVKLDVTPEPGSSTWNETFSFERFTKLSQANYEAKVVSGKFVAFVGDRLSFIIAVEK